MKDQEMIMETVQTPDEKKKETKRYLILLLIDTIFMIYPTYISVLIKIPKDPDTLGLVVPTILLYLFSWLYTFFHGFVGFCKFRKILYPTLILSIPVLLSVLIVGFYPVPFEEIYQERLFALPPELVFSWVFNITLLWCFGIFHAICGGFIAKMISKVKKISNMNWFLKLLIALAIIAVYLLAVILLVVIF